MRFSSRNERTKKGTQNKSVHFSSVVEFEAWNGKEVTTVGRQTPGVGEEDGLREWVECERGDVVLRAGQEDIVSRGPDGVREDPEQTVCAGNQEARLTPVPCGTPDQTRGTNSDGV